MAASPDELYPETAVLLAPLSGYTDLPFRRACRRHGCTYAFTPLVDARSILYGNPRTEGLLARGEDEPWLGVQLVGENPEALGRATEQLRSRAFEVVDLNLGCPVPKVTRKGAGAAMGRTPERAARCVEAIVRRAAVPVTAKIRVLDAADPTPTVLYARRLRDAGIRVLTIHGRTWEQVYSGPVAGHVIRAVRDDLGIPVVANGGVMDADSAAALRQASGCTRVMVARGAIGNPWIFADLAAAVPTAATHAEICDELERHILAMVEFYGEGTGMRNARKIILAYLTGRGYRRVRRGAVTSLARRAEFLDLLAVLRAEGPSPKYRPSHVRGRGESSAGGN